MRLRFVDRLVALEPRRKITVEKCVSFEEAMLLRPGLARGAPATLMLEWLGQATQLLVAESTDYALLPLIGSFAYCTIYTSLGAGEVATVEVDVQSWHETEAMVHGTVRTKETTALHIERAACAFVPLAELCDPAELRAAARAARGEFPGPVRA